MRKHIAFLALLPLALGLGACDEDPAGTTTPPAAAGRISGGIYQQLFPEVPLAGTVVRWGAYSTSSDSLGRYALEPAATGAESLTVAHPDFVDQSRWVELDEADVVHSFALMPYDTLPPPAPQSLAVTSVEGAFLRLSWTPPADLTDVAGFWLRKSPGDPSNRRFDAADSAWVDIAVSPSRIYDYELSSIDASGNLSAALSATGELNALPLPSRITALPDADYDRVPLAWTSNQDEDFAGFRLFRATDGAADSTDALVFASDSPTDTLFTDLDVEANALYRYRLYTDDSSGQSATHSTGGQASGAAQRFVALDDFDKRALPLPGGGRLFAVSSGAASAFLIDADGAVLDTLALTKSLLYLVDLGDGRICGYRPYTGAEPAFLSILQPDPLALLAEGELNYGLSTLAWVGGDSLVVLPGTGGVPRIVSDADFSALGMLSELDLPAGSLLLGDGAGRRLFVAEKGGDRRLLRVDLSGAPSIAASLDLPGTAYALQRADDGDLLIAIEEPAQLLRVPPGDFGGVETIPLAASGDFARFDFAGAEIWLHPLYVARIEGFALDWSGGAATAIAAFEQVATPRATGPLSAGGRVFTTLSNGWISLCDPGRVGR